MTASTYHISRATLSDLPALVGLLADLFQIESDFRPDAARQEAGLRMLLSRAGDAAVFVARDGRGVAQGMVTVQLVVSTAEGARSAWIEDVVVRDSMRGRGMGRSLISDALAWATAAGATRAQLLVDTGNLPATAFYDRLGWKTTCLAARRIDLRR